MATARFQYGNPARPAGGAIPIRSAAWRLIGGNNRDLGCCPAQFDGYEASRQAVLELRTRIADAVPLITIDPQTSEWTWRLELDGRVVARSVRGYLRHRECLYNVSHFLGSVPVAALPGEPADPAALLAAKAPAAAMAWMAAILAIESARNESGQTAVAEAEAGSTETAVEAVAKIAKARKEANARPVEETERPGDALAAADPEQSSDAPESGHLGQADSSDRTAANDRADRSGQRGRPELSGCWTAGRGRARRRGLDAAYPPLSHPGAGASGDLEAVPCHLSGGMA